MERRNGDYLQTFSGRKFFPLDPRPEEVNIRDIAHALSQTVRFNGHAARYYSVAEHSVHVSRLCTPKHARKGLLHDASEAYLNDIIRPVKQDPRFRFYRDAEDALLQVIFDAFHLDGELLPEDVRWADNFIVGAEALTVLAHPPVDGWHRKFGPEKEFPVHLIQAWPAEEAERQFLARYAELAA